MPDPVPTPTVAGKRPNATAILVAIVLALLAFDIADRRFFVKPAPAPPPSPAPAVAHAAVRAAAVAYMKALPAAYRAVEAGVRAGTVPSADPKAIGQAVSAELRAAGWALSDATVADPDRAGALRATADAMEGK